MIFSTNYSILLYLIIHHLIHHPLLKQAILLQVPIRSANNNSNHHNNSANNHTTTYPQQPFYPQQPYYPQQPINDTQYDDLDTPPYETQPETIPENVPESDASKKREGKGKKVAAETSERPKGQRVPWTTVEEVKLAERWVDATQNGVIGNSQSGASFWRTVQDSYNRLVDRKRGADQITGKWSKLQKDIKIFQTIYDGYRSGWRSGANDADIMEAARSGFKDQTGRVFANEAAWQVVKDVPKFFAPEGVMTGRRRQQPEAPINLDEDEHLDLNQNPNLEHLFADDPIRRPPGRGLSRKSQRSSGSSDATSSRCSAEDVRFEIFKTAQSQRKTLDAVADATRKKLMFRAFEVLNNPINPNLPPEEQEFLQGFREELKTTYLRKPNQQADEETESD